MDGYLLMQAREALEEKRRINSDKAAVRLSEVYLKLPRVRELDREIKKLFTDVVAAALRDKSKGMSLEEIDKKGLELRAQRAEELVKAGYPADYTDEKPECPHCGDTGYIRGIMCDCLKKEYEKARAKSLSSLIETSSSEFADFKLDYYSEKPDPKWGISPRDCMQIVYDSCLEYSRSFGEKSPNLMMRGGTGLGKTFLCACIAKTLADQGVSVVYDTAVSAFAAFEEQRFSRDAAQYEKAAQKVERMLTCQLMILDDLGTEMTTQMTQSALYTLVNTRLNENKKTIISTNLSAEELTSRYTAQTVSRINGEYDVLTFLGEDIRAIKKKR